MSNTRISWALPIVGASALACSVACSSANGNVSSAPDGGGTSDVSTASITDAGATDAATEAGIPGLSYTRIDDMEGPGPQVSWTPPAGAFGPAWGQHANQWIFDPHAPVPAPYETFPGITSSHAARVRTPQPLPITWGGAAVEFAPHPDGGPDMIGFGLDPVDLSKYRGITFWAMAAQNLDSATLQVRIQDKNTYSGAGVCLDSDGGTANCLDGFAATRDLTGSFMQYTIDFSELAQEDWGFHPTPDTIDLHQVYSLVFQVNAPDGASSLSFDVWVDDLYFVNY